MAARPPGQPPSGEDTAATAAEPSKGAVTIEAIADALRAMLRRGIDTSSPPPDLLGLACVAERARDAGDTGDDGLALGLRDVLADALDALGDGPSPTSARLLLGADVGSRGRPVAERRRLAADALDQTPTNFRQNYEASVLRAVATELYRIEAQTTDSTSTATAPTAAAPTGAGLPALADSTVSASADVADGEGAAEDAPVPVADQPPATPTMVGRAGAVAGGRRPRLRRLGGLGRRAVASPFRDRLVLAAGLAGWVWWRWGLDRALLWVVLPGLVLHGLGLVVGMFRGQIAARLPRLVVVVFAAVLAVNKLTAAGSDDPAQQPLCDPLTNLSAFPDESGNCVESTPPEEPSPAEVSPYYTATTYIDAMERVEPTCPPDDNRERRTNFTGPPPQCIDPDADYSMTVDTSHGRFRVELYEDESPQAINSLAFLAGWHYWDGAVLDNPTLSVPDAYEVCRNEQTDDDVCEDRIDDYIGVRWAQALPPFDPDSDDGGPGYTIEVEPADARYDTESPTPPHYVVLPEYTTTVDRGSGEAAIWVNVSEWFIVFAPTMREHLNENRAAYTPVGELDDPDQVVSNGPAFHESGRQTSAPIVIETIYVETSAQRDHREETERIRGELDELENEIANLERDINEQLDPPLGQEPATDNELADEREELEHRNRQRDRLQEQLDTLEQEGR